MTSLTAAEETAPNYALELKVEPFDKIAKGNGWNSNAEIAAALRLSKRQVERILNGQKRPGLDFVLGLLVAAPEAGFRRMFRIVEISQSESIEKE